MRAEKIHAIPMRRIGPHLKNLSTPRKRGAPLSKSEKEIICYTFDKHLGMGPQCGNFKILVTF